MKSDGSLDSLGFTAAPIAGVESIALATDPLLFPGSLYTGDSRGVDRRFNNGLEDGAFDSSIASALAVTVAADGSGSVYVGGTASIGVVRLSRFGSPDLSFDTGTGFDAEILSIVHADDIIGGDIYVGGWFTAYDDASAKGIVRLQPNGSPAVNFSIGAGFTNGPNDPDPLSQVYSLARATDGMDIYVGGGFASYNGVPSNGIARLNDDGSLDGDFAVEIAAEKGLCTNDTIQGLD